METTADDRELIVVMSRYFAAKAELAALNTELEAARQAVGANISSFYDPRRNSWPCRPHSTIA
jgi:hypothetical protein